MTSVLFIALLVFPVPAVWVRRRRGIRALWILTGLTVLATLALAALGASQAGGNRLVQSYGYAFTLSAMMRLVVPTVLLPILAGAGVAAATNNGTRPAIAYWLAVLVMFVATVAGVVFSAFTRA